MAFQTVVPKDLARGIAGEIVIDGPLRVKTWNLNAQTVLPNTIAFAYTKTANDDEAVVGGAGVFAGILIAPKEYVANISGNPLDASMNVPPSTVVELCTMTSGIVVNTTVPVAFGDKAYFVPATGVITNVASGNTEIVGAKFVNTTTAAGLTVLQLG